MPLNPVTACFMAVIAFYLAIWTCSALFFLPLVLMFLPVSLLLCCCIPFVGVRFPMNLLERFGRIEDPAAQRQQQELVLKTTVAQLFFSMALLAGFGGVFNDASLWLEYLEILFVDVIGAIHLDFQFAFSWPSLPTEFSISLGITVGLFALQALLYIGALLYRKHRKGWVERVEQEDNILAPAYVRLAEKCAFLIDVMSLTPAAVSDALQGLASHSSTKQTLAKERLKGIVNMRAATDHTKVLELADGVDAADVEEVKRYSKQLKELVVKGPSADPKNFTQLLDVLALAHKVADVHLCKAEESSDTLIRAILVNEDDANSSWQVFGVDPDVGIAESKTHVLLEPLVARLEATQGVGVGKLFVHGVVSRGTFDRALSMMLGTGAFIHEAVFELPASGTNHSVCLEMTASALAVKCVGNKELFASVLERLDMSQLPQNLRFPSLDFNIAAVSKLIGHVRTLKVICYGDDNRDDGITMTDREMNVKTTGERLAPLLEVVYESLLKGSVVSNLDLSRCALKDVGIKALGGGTAELTDHQSPSRIQRHSPSTCRSTRTPRVAEGRPRDTQPKSQPFRGT